MKKIKLIFAVLVLIVLIPSCTNDGGDSKIDFGNGGVPNLVKDASTDDFIDFLAVNNGETFNLGLNVSIGQGEISSMDIVAFYRKGNNISSKAILETNITTFPATVNLSKDDIIAAFSELNSASDFVLGDQLTVSAELTLKDGRIIKILNDDGTTNYGQDIANSTIYAVVQNYSVSCASDLGGTYSVVSSGTATEIEPSDTNPTTDYPYTTVITDNGGGSYTMSDAFGGLEIFWYSVYGLTFEVNGPFNDLCGDLSGSFTGAFGEANELTGTVNPDGTLSIHWENEWGDFGNAVYTKN